MRDSIARFLLCISLFLFSACSPLKKRSDARAAWFEESGRLKVVASTSMVADLVRSIGGDRVDVWTLIGPGHDPHSYELVKGDADFIERADLVVFSGLGLEHGASMEGIALLPKTVEIGDVLLEQEPENLIIDEGGALDPHIWLDVSLWSKCRAPLVEILSLLEPKSESGFLKRSEALGNQFSQLHSEMAEKLGAISEERRYLVTAHDAFRYFARAYLGDAKQRLAAAEGLSPQGQVSISDLKEVAQFIRAHRIGVIFPESSLSKNFLSKLMKGVDIETRVSERELCADTMLEEADFDYVASMRHNAHVICEALK